MQKPKTRKKNGLTDRRSHLYHNLFSKNFLFDPFKVLLKQMITAIIMILLKDFKSDQNNEKKSIQKMKSNYENSWHRSHKTKSWKSKSLSRLIFVAVEQKEVLSLLKMKYSSKKIV